MSEVDYKNTLNLPVTDFPMRADSSQSEPRRVGLWLEENAYDRLRNAHEGDETFIVHCGPPYANGKLHGGHLAPCMLKDIVVRSKSMAGFDTPFVPGWDCHGLPIEWKVEKELQAQGTKKSEVTRAEFRQLCREYASRWIEEQRNDWQRMGCLADWSNPYLTMDFSTEANIIRQLGRLAQTGLLYKDFKPVMWSPVEQTALAEAEIEYENAKAKAIFVGFDLVSADKEALVAWTTTPWTLPSNKALAVAQDITYVAVQAQNTDETSQIEKDKLYWVAESRVAAFAKAAGISEYEIVKKQQGKSFVGQLCKTPLYDETVPVVLGEHVTAEDGTGIVHIAPAHGLEDFSVGKQNGLVLEGYIDEKGCFTSSVPALAHTQKSLAGLKMVEAEPLILEDLRATKTLLREESIKHSVPVSWRSKAPLICRTTSQWFVSMDTPYSDDEKTLRQGALDEISKVSWSPKDGGNRIRGMVQDRPDWCISRQRLWGVPISIFQVRSTGEYVLDPEVFESIAQAVEKHGIDAWDELPTEKLLPEGWLKKRGIAADDLVREKDILDVWFDSGSSFYHVLKQRPELSFPADLYLEGYDQHRGWFQSSLLLATATENAAPYKSVLTHGFVVDKHGKKVSKSKGNGADAVESMDKYGADVLRLWVASANYKSDLRFDDKTMKDVTESYRKIRNTLRYLMGNTSDFDPKKDAVAYADLPEMEKWILAKYAGVSQTMQDCYSSYDFQKAFKSALDFCKNELSSFYLDVRKDTLYCEEPSSSTRRSCQTVLNHLLDGLTTHLTPLMPFTCDEAWRLQHGENAPVYLERFKPSAPEWGDQDILAKWERIGSLREQVNTTFEAKIKEATNLKNRTTVAAEIEAPSQLIKDMEGLDAANVLQFASVRLKQSDDIQVAFSLFDGSKCPRCWKSFEALADDLCGRCSDVVAKLAVRPTKGQEQSPPTKQAKP